MEAAFLAIGDGAHQQREVARYWVIKPVRAPRWNSVAFSAVTDQHPRRWPRQPVQHRLSLTIVGFVSRQPLGEYAIPYGIVGRPAES